MLKTERFKTKGDEMENRNSKIVKDLSCEDLAARLSGACERTGIGKRSAKGKFLFGVMLGVQSLTVLGGHRVHAIGNAADGVGAPASGTGSTTNSSSGISVAADVAISTGIEQGLSEADNVANAVSENAAFGAQAEAASVGLGLGDGIGGCGGGGCGGGGCGGGGGGY